MRKRKVIVSFSSLSDENDHFIGVIVKIASLVMSFSSLCTDRNEFGNIMKMTYVIQLFN